MVGGRLLWRLPGDDVIRRTRIREVAQAVFAASQLGAALVAYIRRPFSAEFSSVRRGVSSGSFSESSVSHRESALKRVSAEVSAEAECQS
jgi:hypothetical protein